MNQSFAVELQKYVTQKVTQLRQWLRPVPTDSLPLKIFKGIYKGLALLVLTAFSPVIIAILIIAFVAAF